MSYNYSSTSDGADSNKIYSNSTNTVSSGIGTMSGNMSSGRCQLNGQTNQISSERQTLNSNGASNFSGTGDASFSSSFSIPKNGDTQTHIYLSDIEQSIIRSSQPIQINETEEITVNGQHGIWANRAEVVNWRGDIPINQYVINEDANPEVINKRSEQTLEYMQELAIRYLRPPTPPSMILFILY